MQWFPIWTIDGQHYTFKPIADVSDICYPMQVNWNVSKGDKESLKKKIENVKLDVYSRIIIL